MPDIGITVVAQHLVHVQAALQRLYQCARLVAQAPAAYQPRTVAELRHNLECAAFDTWRCERLLSATSAANDGPAIPPAAA
jgi:hypothetical protein